MLHAWNQQAVLWDMDGVLVNTEHYHYQSWAKTFAELGRAMTPEEFKSTFGMNNVSTLQFFFGDTLDRERLASISQRKEEHFLELVKGKVELLPGVLLWLKRFKSWGTKQAIASSGPLENLYFLVEELGIREYFDAIVSGADLPGKPNPDVFIKAAKTVHVAPSKCVVIEDSVAGVEGARRAGMKCIAVVTSHPRSMLVKADFIVDTLDKLDVTHINNLLSR